MGQSERLHKIRKVLDDGGCVRPERLGFELGVSRSTLKRDIAVLRDRLNAPITWSAERGGWIVDNNQSGMGVQYELPGLWLSAEEIHALLTMQQLLVNLDGGGLLGPHIAPLIRRLGQILDGGVPSKAEVARRIHVLTVGARRFDIPHFQAIGSALLRRQRLVIAYHARSNNEVSEREVSPQRLVHYRDNWYLDAWCHQRDALRSFSVDAIRAVQVLDRAAFEVPDEQLDDVLGAGYGIFSGTRVRWANLRFGAERARWVAAETWHPDQSSHFDDEGRYCLLVPYADPRELVMDILRHLPDVEVLGPPELDDEVRRRVRVALERWRAG